jgi:hypothetical protein
MTSWRRSRAATWNVWLLFLIALLAGCGGGGSDGGGGAAAPAPTANAGADETAAVGLPIALDGSASDSPTGIPVSYQWTLSEKPAGSTASLTNPTSVRPSFTPDVAGSYTATLVVQANGVSSPPDAVVVTAVTGNVAPRANAGPDASAAPARPITLDGSASRDPNNTAVTYSWRIVEQPPGSHPTLTNATSAKPTFTADVTGRYVIALVCSDGTLTSTVDQVVIIVATGNLPPVANAGPDQTVTTGQLVTLNGTGSTDPNGDPVTYSWCLRGRPEGSTATLSGANTAHPTFTPDVAGSYVLCLTVNDGQAGSASDSVVIEARVAPFNQGSGFNDLVRSIVMAQDGTGDVFVGGDFTSYNGSAANRLVRLHRDGSVANRFGQGLDELVLDLALARPGASELYVSGGFSHFDGQLVPSLIRLTPSGSLDPAFRAAGVGSPIATAEDGSGDLYAVFSEADPTCGPDSSPQCNNRMQIVRLNADGSVDPAFSTRNGFPGGSSAKANPVILDAILPTSNGKLYVGGSLLTYNGVVVPSLVRLNVDGTLDQIFMPDIGYMINVPSVTSITPARDGTTDIYTGRWVGSTRVHDTGETDTVYAPTVSMAVLDISPVGDETNDVLVGGFSREDNRHLKRLNRNGAAVPTFQAPNLNAEVLTIVPVQDGTGDFYIGGLFTTYNGTAVNHFARIHADGSLASIVSGP